VVLHQRGEGGVVGQEVGWQQTIGPGAAKQRLIATRIRRDQRRETAGIRIEAVGARVGASTTVVLLAEGL
jgi:hypothetical protein